VTRGVRGPRARSQSFRRLRFGRRPVVRLSAMTGSATRIAEKPLQRRLAPPRAFRRTSFGSSAPGPVSPAHGPSVTCGFAGSAPARRPAVARVGRLTRAVAATFGRLDGLLRCRCALLRYALPEGAPLENVPMQPRSVCGTFSRTARPPLRAITCPAESVILGPQGAREGANRRGAAFGAHGSGAWRPPIASRSEALRGLFSGAWLRHARFAEPRLAAAPLGPFLQLTGLPSRSALIAPPLRLAALRWPGSVASLERWWPPPGVSTACFVAVAHFSGTRFPRVPPSRMCPCSLEAYAAHSQGRHARRCATSRVLLSP
jgi:hypothetical protein